MEFARKDFLVTESRLFAHSHILFFVCQETNRRGIAVVYFGSNLKLETQAR